MNANLFYAAAALGAVALFLLMQPQVSYFRAILTVTGLAAVGLLISTVAKAAPAPPGVTDDAPFWLYVLMAIVAVSAAVRVVTHTKPVYAALYFILVILASAATFLLMQAEFMAFALVIVYAGAILITYLFVLMLAQQSGDSPGHGSQPVWYDRTPREPVAAVIIGFVVLATLGDTLFGNSNSLPWETPAAVTAQANARNWSELESMPRLAETEVRAVALRDNLGTVTGLVKVNDRYLTPDGTGVIVRAQMAEGGVKSVRLTPEAQPSNSQSLGWALVARFPVSLELAGVILLMAMFGAVVLARKQIELAEDDRRTAVGLPRITEDPRAASRGGSA